MLFQISMLTGLMGGVVALSAMMLTSCAGQTTPTSPASTQPSTTAPSPQGAELCYQKFTAIVDRLGKDLPQISASASAAAKLYVEQDYAIGVAGERGAVAEVFGRSGGLMSLEDLRVPPNPPWKGIVLYVLRDGHADEDAFFINYFRRQGSNVILFGSTRLIKAIGTKSVDIDGAINNHGPWEPGIVSIEKREVVPLDQAADAIALWTWTAEFTAACTRLGKMPTLYKGYAFPGSHERAAAIGKAKFHDARPPAVAPLQLGQAYLQILSQTMQAVHDQEMPQIKAVAQLAIQARDAHHGVMAYVESHIMIWQFEVARDPGLFTRIGYWLSLRKDVKLEKGDFIFAIGYTELFDTKTYDFFAQKARAAGANVAWSIGGYADKKPALAPGEIFIDQMWKADDAVVEVPGYDIRIFPTSGIMQELLYQMVCTEILAQRPDQWVVKK